MRVAWKVLKIRRFYLCNKKKSGMQYLMSLGYASQTFEFPLV